MEENTLGQVPAAITSQETVEQDHIVTPELVPVDTLKRASKEAKEARLKLQQERAKAVELESELHSMKQQQLEQQGKYKEMYEQQAQQAKKFQEEFEGLQKKVVLEKVSTSFMMAAKDAGCVDPQSLWKLADTANLDVDDNLRVREESLKASLAKAKETMPYMFQKQAPVIADTTPGTVAPAPAKNIGQMSSAELKEYMANNADAIKKQFEQQGF